MKIAYFDGKDKMKTFGRIKQFFWKGKEEDTKMIFACEKFRQEKIHFISRCKNISRNILLRQFTIGNRILGLHNTNSGDLIFLKSDFQKF